MARDGGSPFTIDFDGDGTLQEGNRSDEAESAFDLDDGSFDAGEGTVLDADLPAGAEEGVRLDMETGFEHGTDRADFLFRDGDRMRAEADDADDAGAFEDGDAAGGVEAAEDVAGEEGDLELLGAIRPAAA
jgi:hypothetical protein